MMPLTAFKRGVSGGRGIALVLLIVIFFVWVLESECRDELHPPPPLLPMPSSPRTCKHSPVEIGERNMQRYRQLNAAYPPSSPSVSKSFFYFSRALAANDLMRVRIFPHASE